MFPAAAAPPVELVVLQTQYEHALAQRVTVPFDASLAELNSKYTAGLDRAMADAKAVGKLEDILAIEAEKKRLAARLPIPVADDDAEPDALKKFRTIYRQQHAAITATREKSHADLLPPYTTKLKDLEAVLVKGDRVDDAKEVLAYRQSLGQGAPVSPLSGASPAADAPDSRNMPSGGSPVPSPAPPKVRGDDRKAMEWVMANWSTHRTWIRGSDGTDKIPRSAEDLPKGKVTITSIAIDGRFYTGKQPLTQAMIQENLSGLADVRTLTLGSFPDLKDEDLTFIATLEKLVEIRLLDNRGLTDGALLHLAGLRQLKKLELSYVSAFTGKHLDQLARLPLEELNCFKCGLNDAGLAGITGLRNLKKVSIEAHKDITDASLPALRSLPALESLTLQATSITPQGLGSVPMPRIKLLGCNKISGLSLKDIAPSIADAFPNLTRLLISYEVNTPEDFAALAHFKKLEVISDYGTISDAAWPGLLELRSLLNFGHDTSTTPLPDAAFPVLAQLKKLKTLGLGEAAPSETALRAFKKLRPDVKVEP